jgi:mRNA interferase YafQ
MNNILRKSQFKRDFKRILKQGKNPQELEAVLLLLMAESSLPERLDDHQLKGNYDGYRELHIKPDWLLVYKNEDETLVLARTGSHAELFE